MMLTWLKSNVFAQRYRSALECTTAIRAARLKPGIDFMGQSAEKCLMEDMSHKFATKKRFIKARLNLNHI